MSDYQVLDIRDWKQKGAELVKEINEAVADTQKIIIRPLPHTLVMTGAQYDMLQDDPEMRGWHGSQQRVYVTPLNAMDVVIK